MKKKNGKAGLAKKVLGHLKEDMGEYREGIADDKKLSKQLKKVVKVRKKK